MVLFTIENITIIATTKYGNAEKNIIDISKIISIEDISFFNSFVEQEFNFFRKKGQESQMLFLDIQIL